MKNKGITLIALIITIIIMLILAGIVITMTIGKNGIIAKAKIAGQNYINVQTKEEYELAQTNEYIENMRQNEENLGVLSITANGKYNVEKYSEVDVNVPRSSR